MAEIPTNQEIRQVVNRAGDIIERKEREAPLSVEGKKIAKDTKNILHAAETLILEKIMTNKFKKCLMLD
jgi:hypothetical protein